MKINATVLLKSRWSVRQINVEKVYGESNYVLCYETEGVGKNRSQRIMIHYKFIGYIEIPECGSNYKADTRKGVAVEYITKSA